MISSEDSGELPVRQVSYVRHGRCTEDVPSDWRSTSGLFTGASPGIIMYNALLVLRLPREVRLVAFVDDVAVLIVAEFLEQIIAIFEEVFSEIGE